MSFYKYFNCVSRYFVSCVVFTPEKINNNEFENYKNIKNIINEQIQTKTGTIQACLYNHNKQPSYESDLIYLYSHGNSGWLGSVLESSTCRYLSNKASIFVYDYSGYGESTGHPSEEKLFENIVDVWHFLTIDKKVDPKRIILYGHSLGATITTYLSSYLAINNVEFSNMVILQNCFESIQRIIRERIESYLFNLNVVEDLIISPLKTKTFIEQTIEHNPKIKLTLIHGKNDEFISVNHSTDIINSLKSSNIELLIIPGTHDDLEYTDKIDNLLDSINCA